MLKYADILKHAEIDANEIPGDGSYKAYFDEYMNRPHLKATRAANRIFRHMAPIVVGTIGGMGIGAMTGKPSESDARAKSGAGIGAAVGLLASALLYAPIKYHADRLGEDEAWRYAAMRSGKVSLRDDKVLV